MDGANLSQPREWQSRPAPDDRQSIRDSFPVSVAVLLTGEGQIDSMVFCQCPKNLVLEHLRHVRETLDRIDQLLADLATRPGHV
jgi:hypothetical protein